MALQAVRECGLLAYLSATTQPAVVLDSVPLHEAVAARQAPLETPRWHTALAKLDVSSTFSPSEVRLEDQHQADPDYFNVKELPATTHPSSLGLGAASRIVWSNSAYAAFVQDTARRDEADGKSEGIHRGREWSVDSDMDGDDDDDDDEPTSAPLTSPVPSTKDFHFLSSDDQEDLLKFLLDLLEQSAESPATTPGSSFAAQPAATTVELSKSAFTATVLPRFVVLSVLPRSRQSPAPRGTAARTLAALYTGYGEPAVIKNSLWPSDSLPRRPSLGFGSLDSASGTSLSPVRPLDLYMQMLSATEIGRLIRDYDWATTELGPISAWKPELKTMVSCILSSPFKECILLGDNRRIIYNEAYIATAMDKHPRLLGKPVADPDAWGEIWEELEPVAVRVMQGETVTWINTYLPMQRQGFIEETYHSFCYNPFVDGQGQIMGIHNFSKEETAAVVAARRLSTVRDLIERTALARNLSDFTSSSLGTLADNPNDVPFGLLYTVTPVTAKPTAKEVRTGWEDNLRLGVTVACSGAVGVPEDHPFYVKEVLLDLAPPMSRHSSHSGSCSTPTIVDGESGQQIWQWPFEEACTKREPIFVEDLSPFAEILEKRWEEPPRHAVVIPIMVEAGQTVPQAILVLGVGSRCEYNDLYATFFKLLARHIAVGLFAVMTAELDAKRAEDLLRLDKAKTSFFNNVSHELRTPLTLVLGPLDDVVAEKSRLAPAQYEKLRLVQRHANRLLTMVNKLLDFSSIEGGRMQVKFRPTQLGAVTRDLGVLFRDAVERGGLQYIVECDDDPPDALPMYVALELWEKCVYNLVGNATKYCRSGSIEVTLKQTLAEAIFSVKDTGVGIPAQDLSRIFERFHRVESTARTTSGTGIGLALTLEIVKVLGGQLEVESEPGVGSTFSIRLPRGFTHLPIEQVVHHVDTAPGIPDPVGRNMAIIEEAVSWRTDDRVSNYTESSSGDSSSGAQTSSNEDYVDSARLLNLSNRTVLLVEDSPDLASYVSSILSKLYNVVQMPDGLAAWEYIQLTPPSLVITDQMMPRMSGMELVTAIRANPTTALLPVIMISAEAGNHARAEALERGLDDYLCKPFQARELLARVNVHLQLGQMRAELERRVQERTSALIDSERQVRALADRFATLSRVSPVGILQTDAEGSITYANPRFYQITGHPADKPLHQWRDCVWKEDLPKLDSFVAAAMASPEGAASSYDESLEIRFNNREDAWGQFDIRQFRDIDGRDCFVAALTDISRQKKAEALHVRGLEARRFEAEENRRNTEAFLDMSSHELRNPLSGVWQNAELLSKSLEGLSNIIEDLCAGKSIDPRVLNDARQEMTENVESVESILICASHQGRIADDILNVSKLNMGLLSVVPIPFDLTARMGEVLRMFEAEAIQKNISLNLAVGESIRSFGDQWIVADPSRLSQVLLNFLSNSVKYTTDSVERRVTVHLDAFHQLPPTRSTAMRVSEPASLDLGAGSLWVVVGCEDSGKGLSSEELKKLFARFAQANPRSDQYGGSGLGLYVSKKLVELHHGFIEVESSVGRGSTFRFYIPAALAPRPDPSELESVPSPGTLRPLIMLPTSRPKRSRPPVSRAPSSKNARISASPAPPHVLVVEDNVVNQKVMQRQLKLAGYAVTVANNGREGLDYLIAEQTKQPNPMPICACLMDIEMPVMGGLEAIRTLREMERTGEMPVHYNIIAVTGNARTAQIELCLEAGFEAVACKPYKFSDLLAQLQRYTMQGGAMAQGVADSAAANAVASAVAEAAASVPHA